MANELVRTYLEITSTKHQLSMLRMQLEQKHSYKETLESQIIASFENMDPLDALVYFIDMFASKKHRETRSLIEREKAAWSAQSMERIWCHVAAWPDPDPHLDVVETVLKAKVLRGNYARRTSTHDCAV